MPQVHNRENASGAAVERQNATFKRWNQAGDYVINDVLCDAGVGKMPHMALHNPRWGKDWLVDDVYSELPENDDEENFDDHFVPEGDQPSPEEIKNAVTQAKNAAKAMGKMPGGLDRVIGDFLEPTVSWKEKLPAMITASAGKDTSTWNKTHRRRLAVPPHMIYPGSTGFQLGTISVVLDVSGSISERELQQFLGELSSIFTECKPKMVYVLWTDSEVSGVDEVEDAGELEHLTPKGGGGTDMPAAFRYMADHDIYPEQCIVFTDGYTPWGEEPDYDVIWAITTKGKEAPYGRNVYVDIDD